MSKQAATDWIGTGEEAADQRLEPAYWRTRVFRNSYVRAGKLHRVRGWSAKIQYQGVRRTISLGAVDQDVAAAKAAVLTTSPTGAVAVAAIAAGVSVPGTDEVAAAEVAVAQLGTAFQIVDDLTDFEFDVGRRTHNLLTSQIHHHGSDDERAALDALWAGETPEEGVVETTFRESARAVMEIAYAEARASFAGLQSLGHWFDPALADEVVRAIVGLDGVARMEALTSAD